MQLLIHEVDTWTETPDNDYERRVKCLRHFLVFPDGRCFFQDEYIRRIIKTPVEITSHRTEWQAMPTPPIRAAVAGVTEYTGLPCAITTDGRAFVWAATPPANPEEERQLALAQQEHLIHMWPHSWVPFHDAVPGTPADTVLP